MANKTSSSDISIRLSRRQLLAGIGGIAALMIAPSWLPHTAQAKSTPATRINDRAFLRVSEALTGYSDLDAVLGQRLAAALAIDNDLFVEQIDELDRLIQQGTDAQHLSDGLKAKFPGASDVPGLILQGWYLGIVRMGKKDHVLAYEHALMYRPLQDVCVLPTFARGEPHYWARPPFSAGVHA